MFKSKKKLALVGATALTLIALACQTGDPEEVVTSGTTSQVPAVAASAPTQAPTGQVSTTQAPLPQTSLTQAPQTQVSPAQASGSTVPSTEVDPRNRTGG